MTVILDLPAEAQARLRAEATRRGITVDQLVADLADSLPAEIDAPKRERGFIGIGTSASGRPARDADEMLAEGFGRD